MIEMYEFRSRAGEDIKVMYGNFYFEDITAHIPRLVEAVKD